MFRYVAFAALWLLPAGAFAQRLTGYQLGNYAGTNGLYLNPSSIADSRWGTHINLALVSLQANEQPTLPVATVPFAKAVLKVRNQELVIKQADIRGPGLMRQLRNNHAVALTTRYRSDINVTGDYDLIRWFRGARAILPTADRSVQLSSEAFSEIALSYAAPVLEWQQHFLKVGGTYKYIRGFHSSTLSANGNFGAPSDQLTYALTGLQTSYSNLNTLTSMSVADAILGTVPGTGSGFDLGFTYEFRPRAESYRYALDGRSRPDPTATKYRLRLGVSLMDIGQIRYQNAGTWTVAPFRGTLRQAAVQRPNTPIQVRDAVAQSLSIAPEGQVGDLTTKLPQTLSVQVDAQLGKGWFFGGAWWKPTKTSAVAQHRAEVISFGPRYESADSEISVTGNYWQPLGKFSVGTYVRVGIVTFGSDNVAGFFSDNGLTAHLFAGVALPFSVRRPADRDGDSVSDKRDRCPGVAGVWAFRGCPDTDSDGIEDQEDTCPQDAGPLATKGCPDSDNDGIFDKNDACPNEAGLAKFNGCPDTDNDGIANQEDECPTNAGSPALGGCPDTDNDGLRDSQDACPTEAGLKELDGCALKAVARADTGLIGSEKTLLRKLGDGWLLGPKNDTTLLTDLKTYLLANQPTGTPRRVLTLEFSGANQDQLVRVATLFKEELDAYFGATQPIRYTVTVRPEQAAGLTVGFVREKK